MYRCVATRRYSGYNTYNNMRETVYMEVDFYPRSTDGGYYGRDYSGYFNNRYDRYDGYRRPYYGYAYAKTSEDTAVVENKEEKNREDSKE